MAVGGASPSPFTIVSITNRVVVYAPAEWADTLTLFHVYQYMYSVVDTSVLDPERFDSAPDPYHWNTYTDPALYFSDFQDANQKLFFFSFFAYYLPNPEGTFTSVFKNNKLYILSRFR